MTAAVSSMPAGHEHHDRQRGVRHVEPAREPDGGAGRGAVGAGEGERRGRVGPHLDVEHLPVGRAAVGGHRGDGHRRAVRELAAGVVVDHHDAGPRARRREQLRLRREVRRHVAVEVEVVLAEVGEADDVEHQAVDPTHRHRDARDLHDDRVGVTLAHDREQRLQVRRLRCRADAGERVVADPRLDRPDQARAPARTGEGGVHEVSGRRLAVGARDPQHQQRLGRAPVHLGRHDAEHGAGVRHDQRGHRRGVGRRSAALVGEHGHRARVDGVGDELGTVVAGAGQRGEQVAGTHVGRVVRHAGELHVDRGDRCSEHRRQPGQAHGRATGPRGARAAGAGHVARLPVG